jgi:hypothetical protein
MFTDYWVIAQLLAQVSAFVLLLYGSIFALRSLRYWVSESDTSLQIDLERQNYLMSTIMQVGLWFQILALLMFLHIVNDHLPPLVKGAMCATGTLGVNSWGYPLLYLKALSILVYAIYLFINHLDNQEPAYPLTPYKYVWLFPALLLAIIDIYMLSQYFTNIKPDLIATCCSVDFTAENRTFYGIVIQEGRQVIFAVWIVSFCLLLVGNFINAWSKSILLACLSIVLAGIYTTSSIYTLKYEFVQYIYGLPSHLCLFDIFWGKYYAVGYILFGAYYSIILSALGFLVVRASLPRLHHSPTLLLKKLHFILFLGLMISFGLPFVYWFGSGYVF